MAAPELAPRHPRCKFGMYRQQLSQRPRLLKKVLVSSASDIPDDNQFKSRKARPVRRSICFDYTDSAATVPGNSSLALQSAKKSENDTVRDALEQEFMERFISIEKHPEEVKFPVLRASHPGGRIFRTQELGERNRNITDRRHPFTLSPDTGPPPEYSCYYDKHLKHFFANPAIRKKLVEQDIITDDHFIREPYKAFREYIERKKLPHGTNPVIQLNSTPDSSNSSIVADADIKEFVKHKFNVNTGVVDELFSGRRMGSVIPLEADELVEQKSLTPPLLPALRSATPQKLSRIEQDMQQALHHSRTNVVVAKRDMIAQKKKSNAIHQGIVKQKKLNHNKKQMELERWEASLEKLRTTFDRKKDSIFKRLQEIEDNKQKNLIEKKRESDKLKRKFANIFIKNSIAERQIREQRQEKEKRDRARNTAWLQEQKEKRERHMAVVNKKLHDSEVQHIADVTSQKTAKIAQLQLKCDYYEQCSKEISRENTKLNEKMCDLQKLEQNINDT